jgi:hypothetical protein
MTEYDINDRGGDEVLDRLNGEAKAKLKTRRSFELVMRNGEIIRFEVGNPSDCPLCLARKSTLNSDICLLKGLQL